MTSRYPRGSIWRRWDLHVHTPDSYENDFGGWNAYLSALRDVKGVSVLGVTDYFFIDGYRKIRERHAAGDLGNFNLVLPNIELRLGTFVPKRSDGSQLKRLNFHVIFSDEVSPDIIEQQFIQALHFQIEGHPEDDRGVRNVTKQAIEEAGRLVKQHQATFAGDSDFVAGCKVITFDLNEARRALQKDCFTGKYLLFLASENWDQIDWAGQDYLTRKNLLQSSHGLFCGQKNTIDWCLGRSGNGMSPDKFIEEFGALKPCIHGSDAHKISTLCKPDGDNFCWIRADPTFEGLRQICMEPAARVFVGETPPRGALPGNTIRELNVSNAAWMQPVNLPLNAGLVAIIGARGSGKTALADLLATGAYAISEHRSKDSFIHRAKQLLTAVKAQLIWEAGEPTENDVAGVDIEELIDTPRIQYLSQKFVADLCSAEEPTHALLKEIQRVIFNAHSDADRLGTDTFDELLGLRLQSALESRGRHRETLSECSESVIAERQGQDSLPALLKERGETTRNLEKDRADLKTLVPKGQEVRAARHAAVSQACEEVRQRAATSKLRLLALQHLQRDVADFRSRRFVNARRGLMQERAEAELSAEDWKLFQMDFVGPVDQLLIDRAREATAMIAKLEGPAKADPSINENRDANIPLIGETSALDHHTLHLLECELSRLQKIVGVDAQNARRFAQLSDKISKAERAVAKLNTQIDRVQSAGDRITRLQVQRRAAYAGVFNAIVEQATELEGLYAPLKERMANAQGTLAKLSFSARRHVDLDGWATEGENLLDLRAAGPFKGKGQLRKAAEADLLEAWRNGDAQGVSEAMSKFLENNEQGIKAHRPSDMPAREWAGKVSAWLYGTDHITVQYGLQYENLGVEQLSPGTRGIVLLLLYLAVDSEDDRPLLIDQPEENLDPQSIFEELVNRFREAKKRRQIVIVTHNANLVVNTDADQVIVARCGPHRPGELPLMTYDGGGLEDSGIRSAVCSILEGGEAAFRERAKRLRVKLS